MNTLTARLLLSAFFSLALGGCAAAQDEAEAPSATREVRRSDALATARQDAARRYGNGWTAPVDAQYAGGFWVVELRDKNGAGLHYAISARDGSIRERELHP